MRKEVARSLRAETVKSLSLLQSDSTTPVIQSNVDAIGRLSCSAGMTGTVSRHWNRVSRSCHNRR